MLTKGIGGLVLNKVEVNSLQNVDLGKLPYSFYRGGAVVFKDEIHILGGAVEGFNKYHYKFNGEKWVQVSTLPYSFETGTAIVFQDRIHIMGGSGEGTTSYKYHYAWNGTSWENVGTLPYPAYGSKAVVYNNELHLLASSSATYSENHYKFDGTTWTKLGWLPYEAQMCTPIVFGDKLHILGGYGNRPIPTYHYAWNGTSWENVSTLPYNFYNGCATVIDNQIHIYGGSPSDYSHYIYNGASWVKQTSLSISVIASSLVQHYGTTYLLGGTQNTNSTLKLYDGEVKPSYVKIRIIDGSEIYTDGEYTIEEDILTVKSGYTYLTILAYGSPDYIDVVNNKVYLLKGMMLNGETITQDGLVELSTTVPSRVE